MLALKAYCIAAHCVVTMRVPSLDVPAALMVILDGVATIWTDSLCSEPGDVPVPPPQPNRTEAAIAHAVSRMRRTKDRFMLAPTKFGVA
jgi:hypothetical protein